MADADNAPLATSSCIGDIARRSGVLRQQLRRATSLLA